MRLPMSGVDMRSAARGCPDGSSGVRMRAGEWHLLARKDSGSSTGSHGEGCAHTLLRIGSITLPSSMDLRQYLEQMQARAASPHTATHLCCCTSMLSHLHYRTTLL